MLLSKHCQTLFETVRIELFQNLVLCEFGLNYLNYLSNKIATEFQLTN